MFPNHPGRTDPNLRWLCLDCAQPEDVRRRKRLKRYRDRKRAEKKAVPKTSSSIVGIDRGVDGWYQAVETSEDIRVGQEVRWDRAKWVVVGISKKLPQAGGIVVQLEDWRRT
jgi:hypothetical protein